MEQRKEIFSAMVTPYGPDGRASPERAAALAADNVAGGVDGVFVCGTTGDFPLLTVHERMELAEAVIGAISGRAKVLVNVSSLCQQDVYGLIGHARRAGADGVVLVAPYYYKFDEEAMFQALRWAAETAAALPVYLYNIPSHAHNEISPPLLRRLADACPNIQGVKDSGSDPGQYLRCREELGGLSVYTGNDEQILWTLQNGGTGAVVASACVFPRLVCGIRDDYLAGRSAQAVEKQRAVTRFRKLCRATVPGVAHKRALELRGFAAGGPKLPFRTLSPKEDMALRSMMEQERLM